MKALSRCIGGPMKTGVRRGLRVCGLILFVFVTGSIFPRVVTAQNPGMQEKVADVEEAVARNRQALAQYTWQEQVIISVKGEEKKQGHFQVHLGPDGKPQKTCLDPPSQPPMEETSGRRGRLKEHIVEKKKEEYKDYADQIKALIQQYVPPEKDLLQNAAQQGNITFGPEGGGTGQYRLVISNYVKQGDKMTLVFDTVQRDLSSLSINTYLDDPSDAIKVSVQFAALPGGPNHVASETIDGVSKQLVITIQNGNYQRL